MNILPGGIYVDVTFGGGGHSRAILDKLGPKGRLVAFDRDLDAQANVPEDDRLLFIRQDMRFIRNHLRHHKLLPVDGILADLGVSSHQFDVGERGFSFRFDGPLDMRMDQRSGRSAAKLLRESSEQELAKILSTYGEVSGAFKIARHLKAELAKAPIDTTARLREVLTPYAKGREEKLLAKAFQALRIVVNDELGSLELLLKLSPQLIRRGGRLVIISYHSLEDRLVKHFLRSGRLDGKLEKDIYGNIQRPFEPLHSKAISPSEEELERNPRSRSARLRIAERK